MMPSRVTCLGLRARLSQAWMAAPLLIFSFYILQLVQLWQAVQTSLKIVEQLLTYESEQINNLAQWSMQAPLEAMEVANTLIDDAVNDTIRGTLKSISFLTSVIENLIVFGIELTVGSWACLTISAVNVVANGALNATEAVVSAAEDTATELAQEINVGLGKLDRLISSAEGLISTVEEFVAGGESDIRSVNLTVDKLANLNLSTNINTKLEALRNDIPTYEDTLEALKSAINVPFGLIRQQLNSTNVTAKFQTLSLNESSLSVNASPINETDVAEVITKVQHGVDDIFKTLLVICALLIVAGIAFNLYKTTKHWKRIQRISELGVPSNIGSRIDSLRDAKLECIMIAEQNFVTTFVLNRLPMKYWWIVRYSFSKPLVNFLIIGVAGLVIGLVEMGILTVLEKGTEFVHELEQSALTDLNQYIQGEYSSWQNSTNSEIALREYEMNKYVLGWVHSGSESINDSVSKFMAYINDDITDAFNNTIFYTPMQDVVTCLIGNKVKTIEEGLTYIHDHSQVSLPRVPSSLLSNTSSLGSFPTKVGSQAGKVLTELNDSIRSQIHMQCICFGVIIAAWIGATIAALMVDKGHEVQHWILTRFGMKPELRSFDILGSSHKLPLTINIPCNSDFRCRDDEKSPRILPSATTFPKSPLSASSDVRASSDQIRNRATQTFHVPGHSTTFTTSAPAPLRASIILPESPRTPLKAMFL